MIDDKTPLSEKAAEVQQAMHDGFEVEPPPYAPPANAPPVTVFYHTNTNEKALNKDLPAPPPGGPSASTSAPVNRNWSIMPTQEFINAGGRLISDRDAPPSPRGGRGFFSMFSQSRPSPPPAPNAMNPAIIPPSFSRPVPPIPAGSLQWFAPLLIQSRSTHISDGFPLVFPAPEMQTHDVTPADWQAFLGHIDGMARSRIVSDPAGHGPAAQLLVGQWSAAFFEPRRLRVTLRPELRAGQRYPGVGDVDRSDARSISSVSSTSSSSSSSSSSDDSHHKKKGKRGPISPPIMAGAPVPQAAGSATLMSYRMERKMEQRMERDQRKADKSARRDERKAARQARKSERRQRKHERKLQRAELKAMRKGKFVPERAPVTSNGRWELIVECI